MSVHVHWIIVFFSCHFKVKFLQTFTVTHNTLHCLPPPPSKRVPPLLQKYFDPPPLRNEILDTPLYRTQETLNTKNFRYVLSGFVEVLLQFNQ